jgi:hypothetical protein
MNELFKVEADKPAAGWTNNFQQDNFLFEDSQSSCA